MSRTLAIGLSGQIGAALQPLLDARLLPVLALSRRPQPAQPGVEWRLGSLESFGSAPPAIECILSLGPLDAFAGWVARTQPRAARIVAIGSTGRVDKRDSPDPRERDEACRLESAEASLFAFGLAHGVAVTVLRPTLLYGGSQDRSLSRLVSLAHRWRLLPLPATATGLRQPVHVQDVARALLQCLDAEASFGRGFDLPGADALSFEAMVRRTLARRAPSARLLRLPAGVFRAGLGLAALFGREGGRGWLHRLGRDQVADPGPAAAAFAFLPRRFEP